MKLQSSLEMSIFILMALIKSISSQAYKFYIRKTCIYVQNQLLKKIKILMFDIPNRKSLKPKLWRSSFMSKMYTIGKGVYSKCKLQIRNFNYQISNQTLLRHPTTNIYLLKVKNGIRTICQICSELTIRHQNEVINIVMVSSKLTLNKFDTLIWCFHC